MQNLAAGIIAVFLITPMAQPRMQFISMIMHCVLAERAQEEADAGKEQPEPPPPPDPKQIEE